MSIPVKKTSRFKDTEKVLLTRQKEFRKAVEKSKTEQYFPLQETDEHGQIDHHTISVLEVFAFLTLNNKLPNEFERLAECPVCRYVRVDEVNFQATTQGVDVKRLCDLHPPFSQDDMRMHVNVCLNRIMKVAVGVLPSPTEEKQVKGFIGKIEDLEGETAELMRAARDGNDFQSAVAAAKARREMLETYGKATGEYQDSKAESGPTTIREKMAVIYLPSHPQAQLPSPQPADVIDVSLVEE